MVLKTRFRDIPFEEMQTCAVKCKLTKTQWEERMRGKPIEVIAPGETKAFGFTCAGPFYRFVINPGEAACSHMAEIGD